MFRIRDLAWLLAYPVYQIIGTFRHEASHALVAILQGATITKFVFWPSITEHGFYWGYVRSIGTTNWVFSAAPYLCDLLTFALFFIIVMWVPFHKKWVWLNLIIIGLISPLVNSFYNYWGNGSSRNDVGKLLGILPGAVVHWYFVTSLVVYLLGIILVLKYSETAVYLKTNSTGR